MISLMMRMRKQKNKNQMSGLPHEMREFFHSIGNSSGFPIEEQNNDAQLAGVMFIAAQSARARRILQSRILFYLIGKTLSR